MSKYPFEYEDIDVETNEKIKKEFRGFVNGVIRCKPSNLIMPKEFTEYGEKIYNMEVRKDDIWIITYPKAGTTWTQAAIWGIMNEAKFENLTEGGHQNMWHFIELDSLLKCGITHIKEDKLLGDDVINMVESSFTSMFENALVASSPRYIKSHLPFCHLPQNLLDTAKVVYVARNPKDTLVSYFYHYRDMLIHDFHGDFADFFKYAMNNLVAYDPYWPHVNEAYQFRNHPNMLFLFYEDMKKDFPAAIRKLAAFLGKSITEEQVEKINFELKFENMKKNPLLNFESFKHLGLVKKGGDFFRKGLVGDWKQHFTSKMLEEFEEWSKRGRQETGIKFTGD